MTTMTTNIRIPADTVRTLGLTTVTVRALVFEVECPITVELEADWSGQNAIVISMTTDDDEIGDAASDELIECVARTHIRHMVSHDRRLTHELERHPIATPSTPDARSSRDR